MQQVAGLHHADYLFLLRLGLQSQWVQLGSAGRSGCHAFMIWVVMILWLTACLQRGDAASQLAISDVNSRATHLHAHFEPPGQLKPLMLFHAFAAGW